MTDSDAIAMDFDNRIKPVKPQRGRPLYQLARDSLLESIEGGLFQPGEQIPSTEELGKQLSVSLVTAHRALQELVNSGVLVRSQGRGTFVHRRFQDRKGLLAGTRLGLVFSQQASLGDFYHGQILEGMRQEAHELNSDLIILRFGEDVRNECQGYLFVNPQPEKLREFVQEQRARLPILIVGARSPSPEISSVEIDDVELAEHAVEHLRELGHRKVGYVGEMGELTTGGQDRWIGFHGACERLGLECDPAWVLRVGSWYLDDAAREDLAAMLRKKSRPTAIFAAGHHFAMDVYNVAAQVGLRIPEDLSVVGVDDPQSAALLAPPMTTLRQPLVEMGTRAVRVLCRQIQEASTGGVHQTLKAELVVRESAQPLSA